MLYPLKFKAQYQEKIWGGQKIKTILHKNFSPLSNCGESWEISGMPDNSSEISNGFLAGNTLNEIVEVYMGDLVGEKVFDMFGNEFPLLIKFIDAKDDLSIQVHPDDDYARKHHLASGKTEMWYIIETEKNTKVNVGFKEQLNLTDLEKHIQNNTLENVLNFIPIQKGDAFYIPAGQVHAICKGTLLAEIQQCADTTFRLYDYNRKDQSGQLRPLHIKEALEAIKFDQNTNAPIDYHSHKNTSTQIVRSPYFAVNTIDFDHCVEKVYAEMDSFVIYICLEGKATIGYEDDYEEKQESIFQGECVLIPALLDNILLNPQPQCKLLEVYIP